MPRFKAKDNVTGETVSFDWNNPKPPTDDDIDRITGEQRQSRVAAQEKISKNEDQSLIDRILTGNKMGYALKGADWLGLNQPWHPLDSLREAAEGEKQMFTGTDFSGNAPETNPRLAGLNKVVKGTMGMTGPPLTAASYASGAGNIGRLGLKGVGMLVRGAAPAAAGMVAGHAGSAGMGEVIPEDTSPEVRELLQTGAGLAVGGAVGHYVGAPSVPPRRPGMQSPGVEVGFPRRGPGPPPMRDGGADIQNLGPRALPPTPMQPPSLQQALEPPVYPIERNAPPRPSAPPVPQEALTPEVLPPFNYNQGRPALPQGQEPLQLPERGAPIVMPPASIPQPAVGTYDRQQMSEQAFGQAPLRLPAPEPQKPLSVMEEPTVHTPVRSPVRPPLQPAAPPPESVQGPVVAPEPIGAAVPQPPAPAPRVAAPIVTAPIQPPVAEPAPLPEPVRSQPEQTQPEVTQSVQPFQPPALPEPVAPPQEAPPTGATARLPEEPRVTAPQDIARSALAAARGTSPEAPQVPQVKPPVEAPSPQVAAPTHATPTGTPASPAALRNQVLDYLKRTPGAKIEQLQRVFGVTKVGAAELVNDFTKRGLVKLDKGKITYNKLPGEFDPKPVAATPQVQTPQKPPESSQSPAVRNPLLAPETPLKAPNGQESAPISAKPAISAEEKPSRVSDPSSRAAWKSKLDSLLKGSRNVMTDEIRNHLANEPPADWLESHMEGLKVPEEAKPRIRDLFYRYQDAKKARAEFIRDNPNPTNKISAWPAEVQRRFNEIVNAETEARNQYKQEADKSIKDPDEIQYTRQSGDTEHYTKTDEGYKRFENPTKKDNEDFDPDAERAEWENFQETSGIKKKNQEAEAKNKKLLESGTPKQKQLVEEIKEVTRRIDELEAKEETEDLSREEAMELSGHYKKLAKLENDRDHAAKSDVEKYGPRVANLRSVHAEGKLIGMDHGALSKRAKADYGVESMSELTPEQLGEFEQTLKTERLENEASDLEEEEMDGSLPPKKQNRLKDILKDTRGSLNIRQIGKSIADLFDTEGEKKGGLRKLHLQSGETTLKGEGLGQLARDMRTSRNEGEKTAGGLIADYKENTGKLTKQEFSNFMDVLQGQARAMNQAVADAARRENAIINRVQAQSSMQPPNIDPITSTRKDRALLPDFYTAASRNATEYQMFGKRKKGIPEDVRREIDQIKGDGGDYRSAYRIADAYFNPDRMTEGERVMWERLSGFEVATKLGQSVISNATQPVNIALVTGNMTLLKSIAKNITNHAKVRDLALRSGSTLSSVTYETQLSEGVSPHGFSSKMLEYTGFSPVEVHNRTLASMAGAEHAVQMFKRLKKNPDDAYANRHLSFWLGLDPKELKKQDKITMDQILTAAHTLSDRTQFRTSPLEIPPSWRSSVTARMVTLFKSFAFNQTKFMKDVIFNEIKAGNYRVLIPLLTTVPLVGTLADRLKRFASGRKQDKAFWDKILGAYSAIGAWGLVGDMSARAAVAKLGDAILGPIISDGVEFIQNLRRPNSVKTIKKQLIRSIPVAGKTLVNTDLAK